MRPPRVLVAVPAVLAVVALGLTACSDDGSPVDTTPRESPSSSTPTSSVPTTSTPPSPEPSATPSATPPATENAVPDACAVVTAQQMSDVLFVPVELTTSDGGCRYAVPDDATAPVVEYAQASGFTAADVAEAKDTAVQRTDGRVQPVDDVGDEAFFAIGPGDTGQITGAGGVLVGDVFVQVTVTQDQDLIEPEVGQYTIDAIGLAGDALGG